ncbi:MAG: membrane dipeptidase [Deferribacteres bacterium]|nr:dipeptidase [candidate division KSB1 bacterium]MCB9510554.1 membrane dipeptidase [Deferribacteres bacterium]
MSSQNSSRIHPNDPLWSKALTLHKKAIVIDTHSDLPMRMLDDNVDISKRRDKGHQDIPRMLEGGLDTQFLAIYISNEYAGNSAMKRAIEMVEPVFAALDQHAESIELATSPSDICRLKKEGKIAAVLALEGGHALEGSLLALKLFYRIGFRYMTLTHIRHNDLSDSSTDEPKHNGLSDLGKEMVREMNRLGMMVDVSHISDAAFWDVLKTSSAPVLATHSSAREIASLPRNMSDEMIQAMAERGGVIQLCFGSAFLHPAWAERGKEVFRRINESKSGALDLWSKIWAELNESDPLPQPQIDDLIAHIDHVVKLVGVDHVGLGSDYDGVDYVPEGLDDVSMLPNITFALCKKGYSDAAIEKILGGNLLRLWQEVEKTAALKHS